LLRRRSSGLAANEGVFWIVGGVRRRFERLQRFTHALIIAAQIVERAIVSNPKQPGAESRQLLQAGQLVVRAGQGVLNDILTVEHCASRRLLHRRKYLLIAFGGHAQENQHTSRTDSPGRGRTKLSRCSQNLRSRPCVSSQTKKS
jgi:hypothetical protein